MENKRKIFKIAILILVFFTFLLACEKKENKTISVVSREEGSGTRGSFIELFKIEEKDDNGKKVDKTTDSAIVTNSTAIMLTTVSGDENSIGYVSLGSLNNTVKTLEIDGAKATVDEIKSGKYKIFRPFNVVTKETISPAAQDFMNFILSSEGQGVIEKKGYIPVDNVKPYQSKIRSGKITISGSSGLSSVTPVMEKLKEAYLAINSSMIVEIQQSDSSTGVINTIDGISDIGMVSRDLKDTEKQKGVNSIVIAMDGIAVVVNPKSSITKLTSSQVKDIFTGSKTSWSTFLSQ